MKRLIGISLILALLLTGCGGGEKISVQTPEDTIHTAFTALKELDMDTFNNCTNNKIAGGYRMLDDLFNRQAENETYHQLAQVMVENLSWEINSVEIRENSAMANVTIHNKDFSDSIGMFVADLIKKVNLNQKDGMNLSTLIRTTVNLKKSDNGWQIQLDESLCDSLTGHLGSKDFSEHVSAKVTATEELLERNLERWGISEQTGEWTKQLEDKLNNLLH